MANFTFKKVPRATGLAFISDNEKVTIKVNKKECGLLSSPHWSQRNETGWKIQFAIKKEPTKESPADFKWITLNARFENETKAREWLSSVAEKIQEKYEIYTFND